MSILDYIDTLNLNLKVNCRISPDSPSSRFYASIDGIGIMKDGMLRGTFGNGETPEAAIKDYCKEITGEKIAIGAYTANRKEMIVPYLTYEP